MQTFEEPQGLKTGLQESALFQFGQNLTERARAGLLDPVIGRDQEIRRVIQILSRRTKNNPVLVGEAGVGKTAIVEGLAQRIVKGEVPESLKSKELIQIDISSIVAGAAFRGQFEGRLKALIDEIKKAGGKFILFLDELHTLVGAGKAEGAIDAANILKPALARGELRAVGATTTAEYRLFIEKDPALERRFQPVKVEEPSLEDTIHILRGLKERYELHHGIRIGDAAIEAAANLSTRYVSDRFLPDKAIDLIDEASAALRMAIDSMPEPIEILIRQLTRLKVEIEAAKRSDSLEKDLVKEKEEKLKRLSLEYSQLEEKWQKEKASISRIHDLRSQLDQAKSQAEQKERAGELEAVAELRYDRIPKIETELSDEQSKIKAIGEPLLKEEVESNDIALVIARWTGIPAGRLLESEASRLLKMESGLKKRVVGQEPAISAIASALRRSRAGLADQSRPIGSFIFLGPTGVGKTETAKALAEFLFDDERAMIRVDMSEFSERHTAARLIGAPPGYIGYDEAGQLTEQVRHRPYSVLLLDEIEKAHPQVFNLLLQVLDDGRLTDGKGRVVSFRNTVIIMTSNVGTETLAKQAMGFGDEGSRRPETTSRLLDELKNHFRPEFINRIDEVVVFSQLSRDDLRAIVEIQLDRLTRLLEREKAIKVVFSEGLRRYLAKAGFDPDFGARPLKRLIEKKILDPLSFEIIGGKIDSGQEIVVDFKNSRVKIGRSLSN